MKIAILGTRGIPNCYGGFEQYATQLSVFLVAQGWKVVVYNSSRHPYRRNEYLGVVIKHKYDPGPGMGAAGQFIYDLACIWDARHCGFDVIYQLGYTSSAIFNFLLPGKALVVTNMDGLEWKRSKYNKMVQRFLKFSEWLVTRKSDLLIADSPVIRDELLSRLGCPSFYSAYAATIPTRFCREMLNTWQLTPYRYFLIIARMEPENNLEMLLSGYLQSHSTDPIVVVGDTSNRYGKWLRERYRDPRLRFLGAIYDKVILDAIRHFSCLYFHGHSVGGTNPSLLEAMACSCNIVAHDNLFNRSVLSTNALYFQDKAEVADIIRRLPHDDFKTAVANNLKKIRTHYSEAAVFLPLKNKIETWIGGAQ